MIRQIKNILVPVDFTANSQVAISRALEFCQDGNYSTIHLFHVQKISRAGLSHFISRIFSGYSRLQLNLDMKNSVKRLEDLRTEMELEHKFVRVNCWVNFGESVQECIIKKAIQLSADLIIIGKSSHRTFLPLLNTVIPSKIAAASGIPVLTSKPGSIHQEIKTVVIPIGSQYPATKLEMIRVLKKSSRPHIRLVVFQDDRCETSDPKQLLLQTYRVFKSMVTNPVHFEVLDGRNNARDLLKYCIKVGADVLVLYSGTETRVGNWTNSYISDLVPPKSRTQILTISRL